LDIDTTSKNVGCDEHLDFTGTELFEDAISVGTIERTMNCDDMMAIFRQTVCDLIRSGSSLLSNEYMKRA
jgi:hypothetical protein